VSAKSAIRQTEAFVDESGRGGAPQRLLDRLARLHPVGVAVGGVVAARHWHPALDLHGLPRLDVTVHAPEGRMDTGFVERLDPALVPAPAGAPPLLVLHALPRAESLFTVDSEGGLPITDPVEALLDRTCSPTHRYPLNAPNSWANFFAPALSPLRRPCGGPPSGPGTPRPGSRPLGPEPRRSPKA